MQLASLAVRNVFRNKRRTWLTATVIAFGVAGMVVLSGFLTGEINTMLDNSIRTQSGHLQVHAPGYAKEARSLPLDIALNQPHALVEKIQQMPEVDFITPHINFVGMLSNGDRTLGMKVQAVDPAQEVKLNYLNKKMVDGQYLSGGNQVLVGKKLAKSLKLKTGGTLTLLANTAAGSLNAADLKIAGIFETGSGLDESTVIMPLDGAQTLLNMPDQATDLTVFLKNREDSVNVQKKIAALGSLEAQTWQELGKDILSFVATAKSSQSILSAVVLIIVVFSIINTMSMSVTERTREIGTMMAMGTYQREIITLFLLEGGIMGLLGGAIGTLVGGCGAFYFAKVGIHYAGVQTLDVGFGDVIYGEFSWISLLFHLIFGILIAVFASAYPAWMASRLKPVQALRQT